MQILSFISPNTTANLLNPDEVEANRRGEITPAQNSRLNAMTFGRQGCATLVIPIFTLGIITFVLFTSLLGSSGIGWFSLIPVAIMAIVLVGFSKGIYSWWRNTTRLKADRANGVVRSGVGALGYSPKNGFSARVNEEDLMLSAAHDSSGLLPGVRYNFYYLPESRFVLSAEQLGEVSSGQVRLALTDILAQANGFTLDDLRANQNGEVTDAQRWAGVKKVFPGVILMGIAFIFGLLFLYPFLSDFDFSSNLVPLLFVGGFLAIFVAIGFTMVLNAILDFNTSEPEVVEGEGRKISRRKSSGKSSRSVYYYVIGDHEFEVPQKAYPALVEGINYRAFFMPRSKRLVTLEPTSIPGLDR
jgi:hypothetical protein